jgi:hypothetical protein
VPTPLPAVTSVTPSSFGTAGGDTVTISGANFRSSSLATAQLNVTYGATGYEYVASGCTLTSSSSDGSAATIECVTVAGYGEDHSWMLHVNTIQSAALSCANSGVCTR